MDIRRSSTGVPYLTDGTPDKIRPASRRLPPRLQVAIFATVFVILQSFWTLAAGSAIERFVIEDATVRVAAALSGVMSPDVQVSAAGSRLVAPDGGINVLKGCEGTEVLFLLIAAFSISGLSWMRMFLGLLVGVLLVYLLNELRILALFYAYRHDQALFNQLHGIVAPVVMVLLVGLYFYSWQHLSMTGAEEVHGPSTS